MSNTEENISLEHSNQTDIYTQENINHYYHNRSHIDNRLKQLEIETSIEQLFSMHDMANISAGILLSVLTKRKKWLFLPALITVVQAVQLIKGVRFGTSLLHSYGFRTAAEIEKEKYALKTLRGDFQLGLDTPNIVWDAVNK